MAAAATPQAAQAAPGDGGPAFPVPEFPMPNGKGWLEPDRLGMSLRDYFAAAALQGWLASYSRKSAHPVEDATQETVAADAYAMADAMLAARAATGSAA